MHVAFCLIIEMDSGCAPVLLLTILLVPRCLNNVWRCVLCAAYKGVRESLFTFPVFAISAVEAQKWEGVRTSDGSRDSCVFKSLDDTQIPALRRASLPCLMCRHPARRISCKWHQTCTPCTFCRLPAVCAAPAAAESRLIGGASHHGTLHPAGHTCAG